MSSISLFLYQLKLFLKKPFKLAFTLVLPFLLTWFLSDFLEKTQEDLAIPVAIVDEDQTETSKLIIERLNGLEEIRVFELDSDEAERMLMQGKIDSIFIISEGFEEHLKEEKRDKAILVKKSSSSFAYGIVQELLSSEVTRISSNMKAANTVVQYYRSLKPELNEENVWQEANAHSDSYWEPEPLMGIEYELYNVNRETEQAQEADYTSSFWSIWAFIVMFMSFTSFQWILRMREQGLHSRMKTTAGGPKAYLLGVGGAHLLLQIVQAFVATILYSMFLEPAHAMTQPAIWFVTISFFIGLLLALRIKNKASYYVTSSLLACALSLIGESFFPISDLYQPLEKMKNLSPIPSFLEGTWSTSTIVWSVLAAIIGLWVLRKSGERID